MRHFPTLFAEVVVSVARKTDAALWPPLFEAVGSPSSLLEVLVEAGELASAACFLLIIDRCARGDSGRTVGTCGGTRGGGHFDRNL